MLTYTELLQKSPAFLCATSLTPAEAEDLLPVFTAAYRKVYPPTLTLEGSERQRQAGGGAKGKLISMGDKLLFILVYDKTYPLQTMQGLHFGLSQGRTNYWIHQLQPVLQEALAHLGMTPERAGDAVAANATGAETPADYLLDGTERRRQRPQDGTAQAEHYSGKKRRTRTKI